MRYKLYLNANDGAYSDMIKAFERLDEVMEYLKDSSILERVHFDPEKEHLTIEDSEEE